MALKTPFLHVEVILVFKLSFNRNSVNSSWSISRYSHWLQAGLSIMDMVDTPGSRVLFVNILNMILVNLVCSYGLGDIQIRTEYQVLGAEHVLHYLARRAYSLCIYIV